MQNNQTANMLKLTRGFFFLNAAVWLVFSVLSLLRAIDGGDLIRWIYTFLMLANAMVMFWFGVKIINGQAWTFFIAIIYMALNVVLSITDQFGWVDALILLLNLCLLGLLFVTRQRIIQAARASSENS